MLALMVSAGFTFVICTNSELTLSQCVRFGSFTARMTFRGDFAFPGACGLCFRDGQEYPADQGWMSRAKPDPSVDDQ